MMASRLAVVGDRCEPRPVRLRRVALRAMAPAVVLLGFAGFVIESEVHRARSTGYHAVPEPVGMLARFELREAGMFDGFFVRVRGGAPCAIDVGQLGSPVTRIEYGVHPGGVDERPFDFDGDGVEDAVTTEGVGTHSVVAVSSGATGELLFEHRESGASYVPVRGRPLPDLDGDGRSELAVYHPRLDRSVHGESFCDRWIDVRSWITIVGCDAS